MCQVGQGADKKDTKQPQIMTNLVSVQILSFLSFFITSAWTLWFSLERLAPPKEGRKNQLTVLKTKQNSTKTLSSSSTIPMESKKWAHLELPDYKTMPLLWKRVSFSLTPFKHGSTEIAEVFKKNMVLRLETVAEKFKAKRNIFFWVNQKQRFRREPLFLNYVPRKIRCSDTHWWAKRPCPTAFLQCSGRE